MSNPENEQRKPGMNGWAVAILVIIVALIAGTVAYFNVETIDEMTGFRPVEEQKVDSAAIAIQHELIEEAENPSIEEYLQYKYDLIEQQRKEKAFIKMPDVIIVDILREHGTAISPLDIVDIYESYPKIYNSVTSGARSQQYLDSIFGNNKEPDTLPTQAPIDSVINTWSNQP